MQDNNGRCSISGWWKNVDNWIQHIVYKELVPDSILVHKDTALVNGIKIDSVPDNFIDRYSNS